MGVMVSLLAYSSFENQTLHFPTIWRGLKLYLKCIFYTNSFCAMHPLWQVGFDRTLPCGELEMNNYTCGVSVGWH